MIDLASKFAINSYAGGKYARAHRLVGSPFFVVCRVVEQLAARRAHKPQVAGSNPAHVTRFISCGQGIGHLSPSLDKGIRPLSGLSYLRIMAQRLQRPPRAARLRGRAGVARRARWLSAHPMCAHCLALNPARFTPATDVDHVIALANDGPDDESNFQSLCAEHHRQKTAADLGYKPRYGADRTGWPQDPNHHWNAK